MLKKIIFIGSFILCSLFAQAQKSINDYKYIIVPKSFEFSKSEDQYQLNSILKFLFNKYGYQAYFLDEELPEDLKEDRCLALTSEASNDKGGMFTSKIEIILKDCFGNKVMTSKVGESRLKSFDRAYSEAMRDAFETFQEIDYAYKPKEVKSEISKTTVVKVEEEKQPVKDVESEVKEVKVEVVKESKSIVVEKGIENKNEEIFYAQPKNNGYQLVDSEPKVVMFLLSTTAENVFIVKGKSAIVYKRDGFWYYSENNGELQETKVMNIKF
ncbi:hypothetical protein [Winogradskyella sp. SYSU M77433]|uniref:hypothetical protein n=1 Tax=Winogradskyella sp. SYSU M77433 TaxID=3042722 RepID=UPI00248192CF|nr:hypothetical protein [Winogradskyella sp. SYSU M77433]MDH7914536.1 hypothetical protein [Winogradskyella sp. SYSU M77433]